MDAIQIHEKRLEPIRIVDINHGPGPNCMSYGFQLDSLARSIEKAGLINSPVLVDTERNGLEVVLGYQRILASKSLGWDKIPCRVFSESEASPSECFFLNLYDNLSIRTFNDVEKGMVLSRLSEWLKRDEIQRDYMGLLGLPSTAVTLELYINTERLLEPEVKRSISHGHLSMHSAASLLQMDQSARSSVFQMISKLMFNINQQRQFIDYILDISFIKKLGIGQVLEDAHLRNICEDNRMNTPQKAKTILKVLRSNLFPRLTECENSFNRTVSTLDLPPGVRIIAPPFFEAPDYRMEVLFKSGKELMPKLKLLSETENLRDIVDPWEDKQ